MSLNASTRDLQRLTYVPGLYGGVHADFSQDGKLLGIEVIDASEILGQEIEFKLPQIAPVESRKAEERHP